MSEQKLRIVKDELEELTEIVAYLEDRRNVKYNEAVELVGACPLCQNHHYPHCEEQDT